MKYDNKLYNYNCGVIYYNLVKLKNLSQVNSLFIYFNIGAIKFNTKYRIDWE